jgi:hypothetical protein
MPALGDLLTNNFVRGAVSGLGVVNLLAALGELVDMFGARASHQRLPEKSADSLPHH